MDNSSLKSKILVTGGTSRFCKFLKKELFKYKTFFPNKKFDIVGNMRKYLRNKIIDIILHIMSVRPMKIKKSRKEHRFKYYWNGKCG